MSVKSAAMQAGDTVMSGKYRVLGVLGRGGMGTIYDAENTWTRRRVALKVMRAAASQDREGVRRFIREAQAAGQLDHPNIVAVLDFDCDAQGSVFYMVLEHLTGVDLRTHLQRGGPMRPREALEVMIPVMHALATAHEHGVVHRDVKPDNIFLAETPRGVVPKLLDFGVARCTRGNRITENGVLLGTVEYMSPEQAVGAADLDGRSDAWSVGAVLWELVVGRNPFRARGTVETLRAVTNGPAVDLGARLPDAPRDFLALVNRALARPRGERHASMEEFLFAALACSVLRDGGHTAFTHSASTLAARPQVPSPERHISWSRAPGALSSDVMRAPGRRLSESAANDTAPACETVRLRPAPRSLPPAAPISIATPAALAAPVVPALAAPVAATQRARSALPHPAVLALIALLCATIVALLLQR